VIGPCLAWFASNPLPKDGLEGVGGKCGLDDQVLEAVAAPEQLGKALGFQRRSLHFLVFEGDDGPAHDGHAGQDQHDQLDYRIGPGNERENIAAGLGLLGLNLGQGSTIRDQQEDEGRASGS